MRKDGRDKAHSRFPQFCERPLKISPKDIGAPYLLPDWMWTRTACTVSRCTLP